jgi:hypothetical protein
MLGVGFTALVINVASSSRENVSGLLGFGL